MPVSTDPKKIESLLARRVVETVVAADLKKKLLSGKVLRIKFGADPTSPDLHLGHAVALRKLKEFQELGHQIVFIIGDYTARVGDPSGKSKTRPMLSAADVDANAKTYFEQASKILDVKKIEVRRNGEWFAKMGFDDILKLTSQFTVARMIERDDFQNRMKAGVDVHVHELLYPAMQAHDSVMVEADVEIGGTDQRFNILAGRDLQRKMGQPEQDCMFLGPTLVGTDGVNKMSKSLGNYVGVSEAPEQMFGKTMSIPDAVIWDWFALTTDLPLAEIGEMKAACAKGEMNPRDAKARLAREIIALYHSPQAAAAAEEHFRRVFQKKEVPDNVPEIVVPAEERPLLEFLVFAKLVSSKSEARRLIEQNGVKVDGKIVSDPNARLDMTKESHLIQKGKRHFVKLVGK
ncbi:tyrosine--tRNA ligase [Candidatus Uhrbacteria bacterium RIFCSPHIGHO2_02_FULL_60_10]|uniref:Tyrosine--tRNA ligase n=1 Tax=Candidatus Uhrbacteria bacterium RIFCSPHIGHO2_02_FULL_60_10 TaxID=1802392 RepID=A0A1F7U5H6_9BACT|nr:MAG: tyrosine--tRNA ligase [Candidatus Uhrbacteria bacterium RIFCSPHIGHO2_02_FULL_60_10]